MPDRVGPGQRKLRICCCTAQLVLRSKGSRSPLVFLSAHQAAKSLRQPGSVNNYIQVFTSKSFRCRSYSLGTCGVMADGLRVGSFQPAHQTRRLSLAITVQKDFAPSFGPAPSWQASLLYIKLYFTSHATETRASDVQRFVAIGLGSFRKRM